MVWRQGTIELCFNTIIFSATTSSIIKRMFTWWNLLFLAVSIGTKYTDNSRKEVERYNNTTYSLRDQRATDSASNSKTAWKERYLQKSNELLHYSQMTVYIYIIKMKSLIYYLNYRKVKVKFLRFVKIYVHSEVFH